MSVVQSSVRALRKRGPVVFAGHALRQHGDRLLIRERKPTVEHEEIVDSDAQEGYGIGLVKV
jgi:hypothetical protein